MKGKVLGFSAGGGMISGEDGKRYKFGAADWKSDRTAVPGEEVDFDVGAEGGATDVYSLKSGVSLDMGAFGDHAKALLGEGASSPVGAHIASLAMRNPYFQVSIVILLASIFLTFVKLGSGIAPGVNAALPDNGVYRITNTGDLVDYLKTSLDAAAVVVKQFIPAAGAAQPDPGLQLIANPQQAYDGLHTASALSNILYLFYLVPVGAAAIVVQAVRRKGLGVLPLATGVLCAVAFGILVYWRASIIAAVTKMGNADAAAVAGKVIVFGLGSYVILLCGLALVGLTLGLIRLPQKT